MDYRLIHKRAGHGRKVIHLNDFEFRVWMSYQWAADDFGIMPMTAVALQNANEALETRSAKVIMSGLQKVVATGLLRQFEHQDRAYVYQHDWQDWQRVTWPAKTANPRPPLEALSDATKVLFSVFPGAQKVPKKNSESTSEELSSTRETLTKEPLTAPVVSEEKGDVVAKAIGPRDRWWLELLRAYPPNRVMRSRIVQELFNDEFNMDPRPDAEVWADMQAGLESQIAGHEWRVKGTVPNLDKWLKDGRWRQRHDPSPPEAVLSDKTSRTLSSAAAFLRGGK